MRCVGGYVVSVREVRELCEGAWTRMLRDVCDSGCREGCIEHKVAHAETTKKKQQQQQQQQQRQQSDLPCPIQLRRGVCQGLTRGGTLAGLPPRDVSVFVPVFVLPGCMLLKEGSVFAAGRAAASV